MSYNPTLFEFRGEAMSLLTGVQSTTNASPSSTSSSVPWITLPANSSSGVYFDCPILMRGIISANLHCRSRVGDSNDTTNYKEQAGIHVNRYGSSDDLYSEVSDDEVQFYRSTSSTIKPVVIEEWTSATYAGIAFESSLTRYIAMRLG